MADDTQTPPNPRGRRKTDRRMPTPRPGQTMWVVLGFLLMLALGQMFFVSLQTGETIAYSEFKAAVRDGRVQDVTVAEDRIRGTFKAKGNEKPKPFSAVRIEDPKLIEELEARGVAHRGEVASRWLGEVLGWVIPLI